VDADRIYLTGLSMGGFGTWNLAMTWPGRFAAIAPICGGGNPRNAWSIRHIPTWVFHGAKDPVVPLSMSEDMVSALRQYNGQVTFTVYPEARHDSWTESYDNPELYSWFLEHTRYTRSPFEADTALYPDLAGQYRTAQGKVLTVTAENGKLYIKGINRGKTELIPESDYDYILTGWPLGAEIGITFRRSPSGTVDKLILFDGGEYPAERIR
jgi:hypothetical protein